MDNYDVIIIGAGAAGLMCALTAGQRGRRTLVLEHSPHIAEKIRISGGGRCNFTNLGVTPQNYLSRNPHFCVSALKRYTQHDFIALVKKHNISFHEKTLGQLFCDNSSRQIIDMLLAECKSANVEIKTGTKVLSIDYKDGFTVSTLDKDYSCSSVVIASGGLSIPKIGASGFGYEVARKFGLNIIPTRAGLVPFTLGNSELASIKDIPGLSFNGTATAGGKTFAEGMIFTHKGISGPAILQVSSYWHEGEKVEINLLPDKNALEYLKELRAKAPKQELKNALAEIFPKKLATYISSESAERMADLPNKKLEELASRISRLTFHPSGTEGYRTAEVTLGGVDTDELSSKTFEAKKRPGLYFIGEVVDVTGWLGGYNFQWAWSSGHCAGLYV